MCFHRNQKHKTDLKAISQIQRREFKPNSLIEDDWNNSALQQITRNFEIVKICTHEVSSHDNDSWANVALFLKLTWQYLSQVKS